MRVLIVNVDERDRDSLSSLVRLAGITAIPSGSVAETLALLDAGLLPDAMLLDMSADARDAEALMTALRSDSRWGWIPIVALVSNERADAPTPEVAARLVKPFGVGRLISVLGTAVERASTM